MRSFHVPWHDAVRQLRTVCGRFSGRRRMLFRLGHAVFGLDLAAVLSSLLAWVTREGGQASRFQ